jgi:hypothetical protein
MRVALVAATILLATPAAAQDRSKYFTFSISGETLYNQCTSQQVAEQNRCIAYITGVADRVNFEDYERNKCTEAFIGPEISPDQLKAAVLKYMNNTSSTSMQIPALIDVHNALIAFFPCPK